MASYQGLFAKFVSMMSPKCSIVENDGELMLMALSKIRKIFIIGRIIDEKMSKVIVNSEIQRPTEKQKNNWVMRNAYFHFN